MKQRSTGQQMIGKRWISLILTLVILMVTSGCRKVTTTKEPDNAALENYQPSNNVDPFQVSYETAKVEVALDGVLDEDVWQSLSEISYSGEATSTSVKGFYGESGIYIGAVIKDPHLTDNNSVFQSSSLELYLDTLGGSDGATSISENQLGIHVSCTGSIVTRVGSGTVWKSYVLGNMDAMAGNSISYSVKHGVTFDGTVNNDTDTDTGYSVEVFVPYVFLGGKSDVNYGIGLATIECEGGLRARQTKIEGLTSANPTTYWIFQRETNSIISYEKKNYATYKVDGKDDDAIWKKDRAKYIFANGQVKVSNYYASEGAYFFFEVKDDKVYADEGAFGSKYGWDDCVLLYLDVALDGGEAPKTDDFYVVADAAGNLTVSYGKGEMWGSSVLRHNVFSGIEIINGKLNGEADGYTLELFIPWVDLGLKSAPAAMGAFFAIRDWDGEVENDVRVSKWYGSGSSSMNISEYIKMTKDHIAGASPAPEIVLDGVLEDSLWKNAALELWFGLSTKMYWAWTENGCYIAYDVTDSYVVTDNTGANMNSSIEVYLDYQGDGGSLDSGNRGFVIDAAGNMLSKTVSGGAYRSSGSSAQSGVAITEYGYIVELYIPWAEFGGSKPAKMGISMAKNEYWEGVSAKKRFYDEYCVNPDSPMLYSIFTEDKIIDTPDTIVYDSSKLQGLIGFGAWPAGAMFKSLKIVTAAGDTKTWSLTKEEQIGCFDYYKKDEAENHFSITANGLLGTAETNGSAFKKAILKDDLAVQSLTVDIYPVDGVTNGCVYLGVSGTVGGGILANPAVCFQISDTNADNDQVTLTISEWKDGITFSSNRFSTANANALYTSKEAQPIRMTLEISGTKVKITLSSVNNLSKTVQTEIDIADY